MELPADLGGLQVRAALAAGVHDGHQTIARNSLGLLCFRRGGGRGRTSARCDQRGPAGRDVGAYLVAHPGVDKISFTGSTAAGRAIGEVCGKLLKPVTLELGGKSAAIVLDDAELDLQTVGQELVHRDLLNNGQTCFLGTRVLAPRTLRRDRRSVHGFRGIPDCGKCAGRCDPDRPTGYAGSGIGSNATSPRAAGRRPDHLGGGRPARMDKGWFVEPTVFADVDNHHTIAQQEIFGPVLSIIAYSDDQEAVRIANDSDYGLGGTVWTSDA